MRTKHIALAALLLAVAIPSLAARKPPTAPGTYKNWGPDIDEIEIVKTFRLADYSRVVIEPLDISGAAPVEEADMAERVAKALAEATEPFVDGLKAKTSLALVSEASERTLIVRGKVTKLEPGSRAKRMFVGFGAGAACAGVSGEIVDAATGEVLLRFTQERRSGIDRFGRGSSYEEIMKRSLRAIGADVANLLKEF
jgi:hypothetical protein